MLRINFGIFSRDLFATAFSFAGQAVIRFGSSLILTRILYPEAYGVIAILMSIVFVVEMLADIGVITFIVRDKDAEQPSFLNTAWTLRLGRAVINCGILLVGAPLLASLYGTASLATPLRVISVWFILAALESMSFPIAIRHKRARIIMYSELTATLLSTVCTVVYSYFSRNFWGIIVGTLVNRTLITLFSYLFYRDIRPRLYFSWPVAKRILGTTKFTMPSGVLTLALSQFDKIVFLRLFDLHLLGLYGLASNIAGPVESLVLKISQSVLYPRCAHNFRTDRDTFVDKYYTENVRLFISIMLLPAAIGGAAGFIVSLLYPSVYSNAGSILQAFMVRVILVSFASPAEDLLIAAGNYRVILIGSALRVTWMAAASMVGYYYFGFIGFTYGVALSPVAALSYYLWLQRKNGMLILRYELYKAAFSVTVFMAAAATAALIVAYSPWKVGH